MCVCLCSVGQSCPTLCDPMDCSPPGSSAHRLSQARILKWVAISFSRDSSWPGDRTCDSCIPFIVGKLFTAEPSAKAYKQFIMKIFFFNEWGKNSLLNKWCQENYNCLSKRKRQRERQTETLSWSCTNTNNNKNNSRWEGKFEVKNKILEAFEENNREYVFKLYTRRFS